MRRRNVRKADAIRVRVRRKRDGCDGDVADEDDVNDINDADDVGTLSERLLASFHFDSCFGC